MFAAREAAVGKVRANMGFLEADGGGDGGAVVVVVVPVPAGLPSAVVDAAGDGFTAVAVPSFESGWCCAGGVVPWLLPLVLVSIVASVVVEV